MSVLSLLNVTPGEFIGSGITDPVFGTADVVVKTDRPAAVFNEFAAQRLAGILGLPVPPGFPLPGEPDPDFPDDPVNPRWVSLRVGSLDGPLLSGDLCEHSDDERRTADRLYPAFYTRLRLFDILVSNTDRHTHNYSFVNNSWVAFDHGFCFDPYRMSKNEFLYDDVKDLLVRTRDPQAVETAARDFTKRLRGITKMGVQGLVDEFLSYGLVSEDEPDDPDRCDCETCGASTRASVKVIKDAAKLIAPRAYKLRQALRRALR